MKVVNWLLPVAVAWWLGQGGAPTVAGECATKCGDVDVPYPFGLELKCARSIHFLLDCTATEGNDSQLPCFHGGNVLIHKISVENATMVVSIPEAYDCYNQNGEIAANSFNDLQFNLSSYPPYRFSDTWNKLTVLGCDTYAIMSDQDGTFGSGCISYCNHKVDFAKESTCSGLGCCQTSIPKGLKTLNISISTIYKHVRVSQFNPCGLAFVVDSSSFDISHRKLPSFEDVGKNSSLVLDWMVGWDVTCEEAMSNQPDYACGDNTECSYFENGPGYRCFCMPGYEGNPYNRSQGCQDINECKEPQKYPCDRKCKNTPGNYTCSCPFGLQGDGKVSCHISPWVVPVAAIVAAMLCIIVSGLVLFICKRRAKERYFKQNGGEILKHQRVKIFTEAELAKATNNYDAGNKLGEGGFASVYRGKIDGDILVAVKKPRDVPVRKPKDRNKDVSLSTHVEFLHEISIISQVNYRNLVKLLGICLETKVPLLVYEFIPNGTLYHHIHDKRSTILRSWKNCLKIASEAASALQYLHSMADPPIIHSDVKSLNILLDEKYSAKVSDFGASVLISPGKTHIAERIQGTIGYLDPEYLITGELTTKSDVYSFGVVLVELLTGEIPTRQAKPGEKINIIKSFIYAIENRTLLHMINFETYNEGELQEIEAVGSLARRCLNYNGMNRPTMREVAEQLARINKNLWADQQNGEETQSLLDETRCDPLWTSSSEMNKPESTDLLVFDIEQATTSSSI